MRQVGVEGEAFPAVTGDAAESLDGMRGADLGQVTVTGEAVFGLACEGGNQFDGFGLAGIVPPNENDGEKKEERGKNEKAAHEVQ
jgi:hypothetical protein